MAQISDNSKIPGRYFGDSSQLINWILDSGATCHMIPQVLDVIRGSLEDRNKYIEVFNGNITTKKQKGQFQIKRETLMEIILSRHCTAYFWHHI